MRNLASTSLATDMVFSDGASLETPSMTGNVTVVSEPLWSGLTGRRFAPVERAHLNTFADRRQS